MKQTIFLLLLALFCGGAANISNKLTQRSVSQVVLHSDNLTTLTNSINSYYKLGYRVVEIENQDVSLNYGGWTLGVKNTELKGEIIVIMEKS